MADELNKRFSLIIGFGVGTQDIDSVTDRVVHEKIVNVWGGYYQRLEQEEAILFQNALNDALGDEMMALAAKAKTVAAKFGLEIIDESPKGNAPVK
jgi:hypothetical protein